MGPTACQLSVKFEAIFVNKQYDFSPIVSCQLSQNLEFRVCQLSVRLICQLSVKNMDDCQLSVNPIKTLYTYLTTRVECFGFTYSRLGPVHMSWAHSPVE